MDVSVLTNQGVTLANSYSTVDNPPTIISTPLPIFTEGVPDTYDMSQHWTDDGISTVTSILTNVLPGGLSYNGNTHILTYDGIGQPTVSQHQLEATDAVGSDTSASFNISVSSVQGYLVLLFSDLTAAPKTGWSAAEPNKGACVTIWGFGFGASRGSSYVTVNGVDLTSDTDYAEPWGETSKPHPLYQRISFWLNSSMTDGVGTISVTVGGLTSNTVPLYINSGNIRFVDINVAGPGTGTLTDPYSDPGDVVGNNAVAGDVSYFRAGTYDTQYNGGKAVLWVRETETAGTETNPIAIVGYPGELPLFDANTSGTSSFHTGIRPEPPWWTVSKVQIVARAPGIQGYDYGRFIGNDIVGCQAYEFGTAVLVTQDNGSRAYGNLVHGARSANKLDHAIYLSGGPEIEGGDVAYNYIYDNSVDRGPLVVINHQDNRIPPGSYAKTHHIHHNYIDSSTYPCRGIGVFDVSWDGPPETEPEMMYVYNNVLIECGSSTHPAIYHSEGHASFFNNTLINCVGEANWIQGGVITSTWKNNIITVANGDAYFVDSSGGAIIDIDNNLYFGNGGYSGDANAVVGDPLVTATLVGGSLGALSPAINAGSSSVSAIVDDDFYVESRETIDIGAYEYVG